MRMGILQWLWAKIQVDRGFCRMCGNVPVEAPDRFCSEDCYIDAVNEDRAA